MAPFEVALCERPDRYRHRLETAASREVWRCFFLGLLESLNHFLRNGILLFDIFENAVLVS
jgi:hypothetical protein